MRLRGTSAASAARFHALRTEETMVTVAVRPPPPPPKPPKRPRHESMAITRPQIEGLPVGALARQDILFARICERALHWDPHALNACKAAIHGFD